MNSKRGSSFSLSEHETLSKLLSAPPLTSPPLNTGRRHSVPVHCTASVPVREGSTVLASSGFSARNSHEMKLFPSHDSTSRCVPGSPDFSCDMQGNSLPPLLSSLSPNIPSSFPSSPLNSGGSQFQASIVRHSSSPASRFSDGKGNSGLSYDFLNGLSSSIQIGNRATPEQPGTYIPLSADCQLVGDSLSELSESRMHRSGLRESIHNQLSVGDSYVGGGNPGHSWQEAGKQSIRDHWIGQPASVSMAPPASVPYHSVSAQPQQHGNNFGGVMSRSSAPTMAASRLAQCSASGTMNSRSYPQQGISHNVSPYNDTSDYSGWAFKHPANWNNNDCLGWFRSVAEDKGMNPNHVDLRSFTGITGSVLIQMDSVAFLDRDPLNGLMWYNAIMRILSRPPVQFPGPLLTPKVEPMDIHFEGGMTFLSSALNGGSQSEMIDQDLSDYIQESFSNDEFDDIVTLESLSAIPSANGQMYGQCPPQYMQIQPNGLQQAYCSSSSSPTSDGADYKTDFDASDMDSNRSSSNQSVYTDMGSGGACSYGSASPVEWINISPEPRANGRKVAKSGKEKSGKTTRSKHGTRGNHLWEFIRDLLKNPKFNPKIVKWENREEGVFRFVESEAVAKMWGSKKCNPRMTYEKLSRAMRTYYGNEILVPVPKNGRYPKKLVYKFGTKATGWHEETSA